VSPDLRHAILLLDREYMAREMLPSLAQQYFRGTGDGFDYELAVVPTDGGLVYHSAAAFTPRPDDRADAAVDLFQVRAQDFSALAAEVSRFAIFTDARGGREGRATQRQTIVRGTLSDRGGMTVSPTGPFSIVVQSPHGGPLPGKLDTLIGSSTSAAVSAVGARISMPDGVHWRLLVKHPSGSLERAVNAARRRNLVISTSILGVLGLSVGLLVLSTRRAHDLARRQLEFVATVSHELRTPLAVIRSAADNLADGIVDDESRIRQYGQLVRHEGIRLTDLVEQILEFAGLQGGHRTMAAKPVDVGRLLRDVVATAEGTPQAAGVDIELRLAERLPVLAGDEAALRRVFQNLVSNAVKYGARAKWVGLAARPAAGGGVDITVSDRGMGISAADRDRIFNPFYRAPEVVAAQIQGAGLGLSLVKRIVEAHGGRIHVNSAPGEGSSFIVTLPVVYGDGVEESLGAAEPQPS
jgi:signal transduction histidine kinase